MLALHKILIVSLLSFSPSVNSSLHPGQYPSIDFPGWPPTRGLPTRLAPYSYITPTYWARNRYPTTRRSNHIDLYKSESSKTHQVPVHDPYQWLETFSKETEE